MEEKKQKHKILVLSNLNKSITDVLKSTISLAKIIDAEIHLFYVKKPTDIVEKESQLSAIREINKEHITTKQEIQNIINPMVKEYGIKINPKFAFGNVKNEIEAYIDQQQPDIIVLGKKKSKLFKLFGDDNITQFVLKKHKGVILIVSEKNSLDPNTVFTLGMLNQAQDTINVDFAEQLLKHAEEPVRLFKIVKKQNNPQPKETLNNKTIEYVFEESDNAISSISKYVAKNKVDLLYVNRKQNQKKSEFISPIQIDDIITNFNVSLLLTGV